MKLRDIVNSLITLPGRQLSIELGVEVDNERLGEGVEKHVLEVDGFKEEIAISYLPEDFETFREGIMDNANSGEGFKGILMPKHADFRPNEDIGCLGRVIRDEFRYDIAGWIAKEFMWYVKFLQPMLSYAGAVFFPRKGTFNEKMNAFYKIANKYPYLIVFNNENAIPERMKVGIGGIIIASKYQVPIIPVGLHYDADSNEKIIKIRIVFGKPIAPLETVGGKLGAQSSYILAKTHAFFDEEIPNYVREHLKPELYFGK
jgi:hypothetical protein